MGAADGLREKTAKGLFWGGLSNGIQQLLNVVFGIVLARILSSEDYGIVGMLTLFSAVASTLQEGGFITALVNRKPAVQRDYNAVFRISLGCSLCLYTILFFSAPLIADFFQTPELVVLSRVVFLGFVLSALGIVPRAILFRNLQVKQTAIITLTAQVLAGITGITMAISGFAYWGLAFQTLTYIGAVTLFSWVFSHWRPTNDFSWSPVREMFGFSSRIMLTNLLTAINNNLFVALLAKVYDKNTAGYYSQANKWNAMGYLLIRNMVSGVAQPVFAQATAKEQQLTILRKMLRFTAFVSFPLMLGLSLIAEDFIVLTITEKWLPSARLMQWLCVWGAFYPLGNLFSDLLISRGKSHIFLSATVILITSQVVFVLIAAPYGIYRIVQGLTLLNIAWVFIWRYFVGREIGLTLWLMLKDTLPFAGIAVVAIGIAYVIGGSLETPLLRLLAEIPIAGAIYVGILWLLDAKILKESMAFFTRKHK